MGDATRRLQAVPQMPPALPQFGHIRRTWDEELGITVAKLLPGDYYVTRHNEAIFTVLGSCVSACVRERKLGIGGMNHFMLPLDRSGGTSAWADNLVSSATRYGNVAMERLINDIMTLGGQRSNLEFKVIGGGKVRVKRLTSTFNRAVFEREREFAPSNAQVESGSVELF